MGGTSHRSRRARAMLGVVVVALIPWTAAGEPARPPTPLRDALSSVRTVQSQPSRLRPAASRRSHQAANPATQSPTFFKTRAGIVVAAVMAAGVGYAIYSAQHDRIHSPGKQ